MSSPLDFYVNPIYIRDESKSNNSFQAHSDTESHLPYPELMPGANAWDHAGNNGHTAIASPLNVANNNEESEPYTEIYAWGCDSHG